MLKLKIIQDIKQHPEVEINGVAFVRKELLIKSEKECALQRNNLKELVLENKLYVQWLDFFRGVSPEPDEKIK